MHFETQAAPASEADVATKALLRAAAHLGLSNKLVASIVGLSEATMSRMGRGAYRLGRADKSFELSILLIRLYRSLDAIVSGDHAVARQWMANDNKALHGKPIDLVQTIQGLTDVVAYLDARRALI